MDINEYCIRKATISDAKELARIEAACFPKEEAASENQLAERLFYFANHFWLLCNAKTGAIISFVDGMVTDKRDLTDDLYENAALHSETAAWQMIFGVNTLPSFRKHGFASKLLSCAIEESRQAGRAGLVLTCKETLLGFYARLGFINEGLSASCHGGAQWYQMRLTLGF